MEPNNNISTSDNGKNVGIISYITIIGWLIAYFGMHQNNKTEQGSYQLRQTLLLHLVYRVLFYLEGDYCGLAVYLAVNAGASRYNYLDRGHCFLRIMDHRFYRRSKWRKETNTIYWRYSTVDV
jgi:hypothetical protein